MLNASKSDSPKTSCRSSDLPRSVRLPTHSGAVALAVMDIPVLRAYSSGSVQDSHLIPY